MPVTHQFVSAIPDGADATLVKPSDWNTPHVVSIADAVEVPIGVPALLAAAQLNGGF